MGIFFLKKSFLPFFSLSVLVPGHLLVPKALGRPQDLALYDSRPAGDWNLRGLWNQHSQVQLTVTVTVAV